MNAADRYHAMPVHVDPTRHNIIETEHHLRGESDRVDCPVRVRAVAALPFDGKPENIYVGGRPAGTGADLAGLQCGMVVQGKNALRHPFRVENPGLDHRKGALAVLFGRLKNNHQTAGHLFPHLSEKTHRSESDAHVDVVAACVHQPDLPPGESVGSTGHPREAGRLGDRQGVHVGTPCDQRPASPALKNGDETCPPLSLDQLHAGDLHKPIPKIRPGFLLTPGEFRVSMKPPAVRDRPFLLTRGEGHKIG